MKKSYQPTLLETGLSLLVVAALIGIGAAIYRTQSDFNPAVSVGRMAPGNILLPVASGGTPAGTGWSGLLPAMATLTPPEVFVAANLSDKINGKADLYLTAGFRQLMSQRFKMAGDENNWLEIFVYDMGGLQNAFSVFSQQRREDAVAAGFGRFSYRTENALFFLHGPFYVEIIGSGATESLLEQMRIFSQNFIQSTPVSAGKLEELELFPAENMEPNSLVLIADGGFGYDRFNQIFTAGYSDGDLRMTAFLSRRSSQTEAQQLVQGYHDFLITYGGRVVTTALPLKDIQVVDILGNYELFFARGHYLAGVHEAADKEQAEQLALLLDKKLREGTGDPK
ncbi:MAG: hypothetical protein P1P89_10495 [Desulfobacterales bacterium]|nr:hypothetical protein [Desulfobacterales bacterium]